MKTLNNLRQKALLLLLLAVTGMVKAQQWKELHTGVTEDLYDVCCIDTNTVFVCGQNGVILKTEDGGISWQEKYRQDNFEWFKIKFLDKNIGFVLGDDDNIHDYNYKLIKTIDGGETWQDMGSPFNEYNYLVSSTCDLFIVDADTLYVACDQLMKSIDGGCSFSQLDIEIYMTLGLYFEENIGYVVWGDAGSFLGSYIAKTTDYGVSWEEIITYGYEFENEGIKKAFFHDKDHISVYGAFSYDENEGLCEFNEIRTEDGFATYQWLKAENLPLEVWSPISGVCFSDSQNGIMVGYWESFSYPYSGVESIQTIDGGNTWRELNALEGPGIGYPAISGREGVYYLALGKGRVYKLEGTYDGIALEKEKVLAFPNPTSNTLYVIGKENSTITLFDFSGRMLFQQTMTERIQKIEIGNYPSGIYFLGIKEGEQSVYLQKILKK